MSAKPEMPELDIHLKKLVYWDRFALHLPGIEQAHINIIKENNRGDLVAQKLKLYEKWLSVFPGASWNDVIQALEIAEENAIASNLSSLFCRAPEENVTKSIKADEVVLDTREMQPNSGSSGYKKDILLKKSPKSEDVVDLLREKAFKWEDLARELHVPENAREEIKDTRKTNILKLEAIVRVWIEQESSPVTWGHLIKVLRDKMKMVPCAESVEEYLQSSEALEKYHSASDWKPYK